MEIPPVMNVEEHTFWTLFVSHKFTTRESPPQSPAVSTVCSNVCLPEGPNCSLLELHLDKTQLTKREEEQATLIPVDAPLDPSSLVSTQLREAGNVSSSSSPSEDCCSNVLLAVAEGQPDQVVQKCLGQTVDSNCECIKTEVTNLKQNSNNSLSRPPKDSIFPSPVLDSGQKVLEVPRIVKHKVSSITFSDYSCTPGVINESSDDGGSYPEEDDCHDDGGEDDEDSDDDNVFLELPQSRGHSYRSSSTDKQKNDATSTRTEIDHTANKCGYETEEESSSKEVCCCFKITQTY